MALRVRRRARGGTRPRVWRVWLPGWLGLLAAAFANGTVRAVVLEDRIGEAAARQVATGVLVTVIGGYVWILDRRFPLPDTGTAVEVGGSWTALTLAFEFGFGHFVLRTPWRDLLADYDVRKGRSWVLVPLATLATPAVVRAARAARTG